MKVALDKYLEMGLKSLKSDPFSPFIGAVSSFNILRKRKIELFIK